MSTVPSYVTLWVTHPELHPDGISRALHLQPSVSSEAGMHPRSPMTGELLKEANNRTFWSHVFFSHEGEDIAVLSRRVLGQLEEHSAGLRELRASGGSAELIVEVHPQEEASVRSGLMAFARPELLDLRIERLGHPHAALGKLTKGM